jgi:hypothetical protein
VNLKLVARLLLLVGGLGHLIPGILAPVLTLGVGQITVQLVVGALSVILALYFIIKKVP